MRYSILFLLLLLIPFASADKAGWYYAGDTFEHEGVFYSVEGSTHTTLLLGVGSQLYLLNLEECKTVGFTTYCYEKSAFPDDDDHIKYAAGKQYFGYYVTIKTTEPELKMTRKFDDTSPDIGDIITATVTIENKGDYSLRDITYTETLPSSLVLRSGPGTAKKVDFLLPSLNQGATHTLTYTLRVDNFGEHVLLPNASYRYKQEVYPLSVAATTIKVTSPLKITIETSGDIGIDEDGTYEITLENTGEHPVEYVIDFTLPQDIYSSDLEDLVTKTLQKTEKATHEFTYYGSKSGTITARVNATIQGEKFSQDHKQAIKVVGDVLTPAIVLGSTRSQYTSHSEVTLTAQLENKNTKTRFSNVQWELQSDLFSNQKSSIDGISAQQTRQATRFILTAPVVEKKTEYPIIFKGTYKTPKGRTLEFSTQKKITVVPMQQGINITRKIEPAEPKPGENATVTVTAKNLFPEYATFTAYEKLPPNVERIAGITYKETSLDRDKSEQLYQYQILIKEAGSLEIQTLVETKGYEAPQEFTTALDIKSDEEEVELEDEEEAVIEAEVEVVEEEKLGFFAAAWDFLKRLFS